MVDKADIHTLISTLGLKGHKDVKQTQSCIEIETAEHLYNIRKFDSNETTIDFERVLSEALAEEYVQMGIDWNFEELDFDGHSYFVERREKLKGLTSNECSLEEALVESSKAERDVERKLGFPHLVAQVRQELKMNEVSCACVARRTKLDYEDFAVKDGHVICLSNQNHFLALGNSEGLWQRGYDDIIKLVHLNNRKFYFAAKDEGNHIADNCLICFGEWWLFSESVGEGFLRQRVRNFQKLEEMNAANLKILASKQTGEIRFKTHEKEKRCNREDEVVNKMSDDENEAPPPASGEGVLTKLVELELQSGLCSKVHKNFNFYRKELINVNDVKIRDASLVMSHEDHFWRQIEYDASLAYVNNLWVVTEFNPRGRIIKGQEFDNWSSHLRTIDSFYPKVKKLIIVYLTNEFCEGYLNGHFDPRSFDTAYGAMVGFAPPKNSETFPSRKLFREFLSKFTRNNNDLFNLFFFLHNVISTLTIDVTFPTCINKNDCKGNFTCEHSKNFACYSDCKNSMLYDVAQIVAAKS